MSSIAFSWAGLPDYAARCIRSVIENVGEDIHVIATQPSIPIKGMEESLGRKVAWVAGFENLSWQQLGIPIPTVFFQCGYKVPLFNRLGSSVRKRGGKVILISDMNWQGGIKQCVFDRLRHRLLYRGRFDAVFTPGLSGRRYNRAMGYRDEQIVCGLYGADPSLFQAAKPLRERQKRFLFVGQIVARKNILRLAHIFTRVSDDHPDWTLQICGSGLLKSSLPRHPNIIIEGFLQPAVVANALQDSRCLVLPSMEEHWGLVVHEAALSGCALALSDAVGAADDLGSEENAVFFSPKNDHSIENALRAIINWSAERWDSAENASRGLAAKFGPKQFSRSVRSLMRLGEPAETKHSN